MLKALSDKLVKPWISKIGLYAVFILCSRARFLFFLLSNGKHTRRHPDMAHFGFLERKISTQTNIAVF